MINNDLIDYKVNQREDNLTTEDQRLVEAKLSNEKKSEVSEWLLWIFLGRWGLHRFYLNKKYGLGIFLLNIFGIILTCTIFLAFIGVPLLCAVWIWWFIDAFYISKWIKHDKDVKKNNIINGITHHNVSINDLLRPTPNFDAQTGRPLNSQAKLNNPKNHPIGKHFMN